MNDLVARNPESGRLEEKLVLVPVFDDKSSWDSKIFSDMELYFVCCDLYPRILFGLPIFEFCLPTCLPLSGVCWIKYIDR